MSQAGDIPSIIAGSKGRALKEKEKEDILHWYFKSSESATAMEEQIRVLQERNKDLVAEKRKAQIAKRKNAIGVKTTVVAPSKEQSKEPKSPSPHPIQNQVLEFSPLATTVSRSSSDAKGSEPQPRAPSFVLPDASSPLRLVAAKELKEPLRSVSRDARGRRYVEPGTGLSSSLDSIATTENVIRIFCLAAGVGLAFAWGKYHPRKE